MLEELQEKGNSSVDEFAPMSAIVNEKDDVKEA